MSNFLILLQSHAGSGVLIVYSQDPPPWREVFKLPWTDGLFDVTWSEANDNVLAAGGGDGRILLVDLRNDKVCILQRTSNVHADMQT